MSENNSNGMRILVAGSRRFNQPSFVHEVLSTFNRSFNIGSVVTGPFSGTDEITRVWSKENGIKCEQMQIPEHERMELSFFDARRSIPKSLLTTDPLFSRGYQKMRDSGANVLLVIPTPDGVLGPTCACLERMAGIINMPVFNGATLLRSLETRMQEALGMSASEVAAMAAEPARAMEKQTERVINRARGPGA